MCLHVFFAVNLFLIFESLSGFHHCLNALEKYCTKVKTNAIIYSRKTTVKDIYGFYTIFYYKHNIVPIIDQYRY